MTLGTFRVRVVFKPLIDLGLLIACAPGPDIAAGREVTHFTVEIGGADAGRRAGSGAVPAADAVPGAVTG